MAIDINLEGSSTHAHKAMFKRINKVKNIGVYNDFTWKHDQICDFAKLNVLYGWNYSGKTTLSRVFRCVELQRLHNVGSSATFEFQDNEDSLSNFIDRNKHRVKVFNSDFIKENLKWDLESDTINPIFILGEESIELNKLLNDTEEDLLKVEEELETANKSLSDLQSKINNGITSKARDIGNTLNIRPFDKRHFIPIIDTIKDKPVEYIIDANELSSLYTIALNNEQKSNITLNNINLSNLKNLQIEIKELLLSKITSTKKIDKLLHDHVLSDWYEDGKEIHKDKTNCEFCGGELPTGFLDILNDHFSNDYEQLKKDIKTYVGLINELMIDSIAEINEHSFYANHKSNYIDLKVKLDLSIVTFNNYLENLVLDLERKKEHPFDSLQPSTNEFDATDLNSYMSDLQNLIDENNDQTDDFEKQQKEAVNRIKKHKSAEFIILENYFDNLASVESTKSDIDNKFLEIKLKKQEIQEIKNKLFESVKGANQVNHYLNRYYAKDDISIEVNESNEYILMRANKRAYNLSEGEKTAIAFSYFIASLEENSNAMQDTIVYIDDPISSLDSNHLFNTYSFIKDKFYKFNRTSNIKHIYMCKQLFISTHNFELLNLIKDWFSKTKADDYAMYLVERFNEESTIKTMPKLLFKHKSEYSYLFSVIYSFSVEPSIEFENLYNLPNIIIDP